MTRKWRGVCVACSQDLYSDPVDHYASDSHRLNVERAERREAKLRAKMGSVVSPGADR